jgi:hypothetical protein
MVNRRENKHENNQLIWSKFNILKAEIYVNYTQIQHLPAENKRQFHYY